MFEIRTENAGDHQAIRNVTEQAFAASEFGHNGEADLVGQLRDRGEADLSLVALLDGKVVGHTLFSPLTITHSNEEQTVGVGLAPISVAPEHQRRGAGSLLITTAIEQLEQVNCPFVAVLGHPDYYRKFGFLPAEEFEVLHGFNGIPQDVFFLRTLRENPGPGRAWYSEAFGPQFNDK